MLVFVLGCSNSEARKINIDKYPEVEELCKNFEKWDLVNAETVLLEILIKYPEKREFNEFKSELDYKKVKKKELVLIVEDIKKNISEKKIEILKKYIDKTFLNVLKFNEIVKYDLSNVSVYFDELTYKNKKADMTIAINYLDEVYYYSLLFELIDGNWKIIDFVDKN